MSIGGERRGSDSNLIGRWNFLIRYVMIREYRGYDIIFIFLILTSMYILNYFFVPHEIIFYQNKFHSTSNAILSYGQSL